MNLLQAVMVVHNGEVVTVGKRRFGAEAEASGLISVIFLGRVSINTVNVMD